MVLFIVGEIEEKLLNIVEVICFFCVGSLCCVCEIVKDLDFIIVMIELVVVCEYLL